MGGNGSGNWYRWQGKKPTVEGSLTLAMKDFRKWIKHSDKGTITWSGASGGKSEIGYFVSQNDPVPVVTLHYRWGGAEDIVFPVRLQTTPTQFGGQRWWFTCPLVVNGKPCNRRAGKLYLPPGTRYFGCRICHNLTYRSSQEAHQAERVFGRLGVDPELARRFCNRAGWVL